VPGSGDGPGCGDGMGCEGAGWGVGKGCGDGMGCEGTGCDGCIELCAEMFKTTIMLTTARDSTVRIFLFFINFNLVFIFCCCNYSL
jgi:hypothetical protein